ncbi:uncharacterized protein LOC117788553 [Drosophila innubila]|uniref:uncharacterized protein LOC117788553 n=1 Tax=Drosophila innubila TaxID=198719 RepID=UPI00148E672D|nr:uncharacterized protein LOC117788553 [Drosophila innubila]
MDSLRKTFNTLFSRNNATAEDNEELNPQEMLDLMQQQQQRQSTDEDDNQNDNNASSSSRYNVTTSDPPADTGPMLTMPVQLPANAMFIGETGPSINYHVEFLNFIDRNAPQGFSQKFENLLPYLALGLVTWPSYWLWRGYQWQTRRRTERIGLYIQRTFQHAKLMQLAILTVGFFMANVPRSSSSAYEIHEVNYNSNQQSTDNDD